VEDWHGPTALTGRSGDVSAIRCRGSLAIELANGDVEVSQCDAPISIELASGDVEVTECAGDLAVAATSGDVEVVRPRGQHVAVDKQRGEIFVRDGSVRSLRVHTRSGDIQATCRLVATPGESGAGGGDDARPFSVQSGHGDITVSVPHEAPFRVEVVVQGEVRSEIPLVSVGRPGPRGALQRFVGVNTHGDGERPTVYVKATHGDVGVRLARWSDLGGAPDDGPARNAAQRGTAPAAAERPAGERPAGAAAAWAEPPDKPGPSPAGGRTWAGGPDATVHHILEALRRGELGVAEAEALLDALEK
jgi:hypothetical protein